MSRHFKTYFQTEIKTVICEKTQTFGVKWKNEKGLGSMSVTKSDPKQFLPKVIILNLFLIHNVFFYFDSQITQKIQIYMQSYVEIIWCGFFAVFGFKSVEMDAKKWHKNCFL